MVELGVGGIAKHPTEDLYALTVNAVGDLGAGQVITFSLILLEE